jgi:hypothetical protein
VGRKGRFASKCVAGSLLVALLLLPVVVAWARTLHGEAVSGVSGLAGFRHQAAVADDRYEPDRPVEVTYRVCRWRPWPTRTWSPGPEGGRLVALYHVLDEDDVVVPGPDVGFVLLARATWWWPGQCRSVNFNWDQHEANTGQRSEAAGEARSPGAGDRVEPGRYRVEAWWEVVDREARFRPTQAVSTDVFVLAPP